MTLPISFTNILNNAFLRHASVLAGGTASSQIITVVGMIFLARFYSPAQFGMLASIAALSGICIPFLSLRYEMAVLIERTRAMACVGYVTILCLLLTGLLLILGLGTLALTFAFINTALFLFVFTILCVSGSFSKISENFLNRNNKYFTMATIPIMGNIVFITAALMLTDHIHGLLIATALAKCVIILCIFIKTKDAIFAGIQAFSLKRMHTFLRKNIEFPRYNLPAALLNTLSGNLPVLIIKALFGDAAAGFYSLLNRIMLAPVRLISLAINRVFIQRISVLINKRTPIKPLTHKAILILSGASLFLGAGTVLFTQLDGFTLLLGDQWDKLNDYALIFIPAIMAAFVAKSVSRFAAYRKNKIGFYYQSALLATMLVTIFIIWQLHLPFITTLICLASITTMFSLIQLYMINRITNTLDNEFKEFTAHK